MGISKSREIENKEDKYDIKKKDRIINWVRIIIDKCVKEENVEARKIRVRILLIKTCFREEIINMVNANLN